MALGSLGLEHRALVPVEVQPAQRVEDLLHVLGGRSLAIGIFDPQHERPGLAVRAIRLAAGQQPVVQGRPGTADVQCPGRGWSEANAHDLQTLMLIGAHVSNAGGLDRAVERGVERGCEAIQIFNQSPRMWRPTATARTTSRQFREAIADSPIEAVLIHAVYLINCATEDRRDARQVADLADSVAAGRGRHRRGRAWSCTRARPSRATSARRSSGPARSSRRLWRSPTAATCTSRTRPAGPQAHGRGARPRLQHATTEGRRGDTRGARSSRRRPFANHPRGGAAAVPAGRSAAEALLLLKRIVHEALDRAGDDVGEDQWWNDGVEPEDDVDRLSSNSLLARRIDLTAQKREIEHALARGELRRNEDLNGEWETALTTDEVARAGDFRPGRSTGGGDGRGCLRSAPRPRRWRRACCIVAPRGAAFTSAAAAGRAAVLDLTAPLRRDLKAGRPVLASGALRGVVAGSLLRRDSGSRCGLRRWSHRRRCGFRS